MSRFLQILSVVLVLFASPSLAAENSIIVQSTTSTQNSGLYEYLLPKFTAQSGIQVRVVAVGTGQALKNAEKCDGDVLLVHAKKAEEEFVAKGYGLARTDLMYNDFVVLGPASDPAGVSGVKDPAAALNKIAESGSTFISRGDDSGTHKKEMSLWQGAGIDPTEHSGEWYREVGAGMGAALNIAVGSNAYILSDRATWIAHSNKGDLKIVVEGADSLFNQYGVILVNPEHCPNTRAADGQKFIDWLLSDAGQSAIAAYSVADQQLFFPNAGRAAN